MKDLEKLRAALRRMLAQHGHIVYKTMQDEDLVQYIGKVISELERRERHWLER